MCQLCIAHMHTSLLVYPGVPRNVKAAEIPQPTVKNCIILVTWDPPAISDGSDSYIVYVPSQNIKSRNESSALTVLRVPNCREDDRILVAAVNHFGCVGMNSSTMPNLHQPSPLITESESTINTCTPIEHAPASTCSDGK